MPARHFLRLRPNASHTTSLGRVQSLKVGLSGAILQDSPGYHASVPDQPRVMIARIRTSSPRPINTRSTARE